MSEPKLSENTKTESPDAYLKELASCNKRYESHNIVVCVVVYLLNTTTYTAYAPPLMITITQTISLYIHIRTWLHCLTFIHKHSHFLMHTNTLMYVQTLMLTPQHNCLLKLNHRILFITIS
jgi:hypothetical protein